MSTSDLASASGSMVTAGMRHKRKSVGANSDARIHGGLVCPRCGTHSMQRDNRKTFFERSVFPLFKFYPWECLNCHKRKLFKMRGKRRKVRAEDAQ